MRSSGLSGALTVINNNEENYRKCQWLLYTIYFPDRHLGPLKASRLQDTSFLELTVSLSRGVDSERSARNFARRCAHAAACSMSLIFCVNWPHRSSDRASRASSIEIDSVAF